MDLKETIDLDTGNHIYTIHISAKEITLISDVGRTLPTELLASEKLSDKFLILHVVALAIERLEAQRDAAKEWPE
jgi:hypothetical protein